MPVSNRQASSQQAPQHHILSRYNNEAKSATHVTIFRVAERLQYTVTVRTYVHTNNNAFCVIASTIIHLIHVTVSTEILSGFSCRRYVAPRVST